MIPLANKCENTIKAKVLAQKNLAYQVDTLLADKKPEIKKMLIKMLMNVTNSVFTAQTPSGRCRTLGQSKRKSTRHIYRTPPMHTRRLETIPEGFFEIEKKSKEPAKAGVSLKDRKDVEPGDSKVRASNAPPNLERRIRRLRGLQPGPKGSWTQPLKNRSLQSRPIHFSSNVFRSLDDHVSKLNNSSLGSQTTPIKTRSLEIPQSPEIKTKTKEVQFEQPATVSLRTRSLQLAASPIRESRTVRPPMPAEENPTPPSTPIRTRRLANPRASNAAPPSTPIRTRRLTNQRVSKATPEGIRADSKISFLQKISQHRARAPKIRPSNARPYYAPNSEPTKTRTISSPKPLLRASSRQQEVGRKAKFSFSRSAEKKEDKNHLTKRGFGAALNWAVNADKEAIKNPPQKGFGAAPNWAAST